ncbi:hypothetical protein HDU96_007291 [Phlyctochytrium bullatum]|nr:hypothetical protein HDU96_007291 [Phlyctochytrium bullatum]
MTSSSMDSSDDDGIILTGIVVGFPDHPFRLRIDASSSTSSPSPTLGDLRSTACRALGIDPSLLHPPSNGQTLTLTPPPSETTNTPPDPVLFRINDRTLHVTDPRLGGSQRSLPPNWHTDIIHPGASNKPDATSKHTTLRHRPWLHRSAPTAPDDPLPASMMIVVASSTVLDHGSDGEPLERVFGETHGNPRRIRFMVYIDPRLRTTGEETDVLQLPAYHEAQDAVPVTMESSHKHPSPPLTPTPTPPPSHEHDHKDIPSTLPPPKAPPTPTPDMRVFEHPYLPKGSLFPPPLPTPPPPAPLQIFPSPTTKEDPPPPPPPETPPPSVISRESTLVNKAPTPRRRTVSPARTPDSPDPTPRRNASLGPFSRFTVRRAPSTASEETGRRSTESARSVGSTGGGGWLGKALKGRLATEVDGAGETVGKVGRGKGEVKGDAALDAALMSTGILAGGIVAAGGRARERR